MLKRHQAASERHRGRHRQKHELPAGIEEGARLSRCWTRNAVKYRGVKLALLGLPHQNAASISGIRCTLRGHHRCVTALRRKEAALHRALCMRSGGTSESAGGIA
jgi:hypothetical protein